MLVGLFTSPCAFSGEYLNDGAWKELVELYKSARKLHGKSESFHDAPVENWVRTEMRKWIDRRDGEFREEIKRLEKKNQELENKNQELSKALNGNGDNSNGEDGNNAGATIIEQHQRLKGENSNLKGENSNLKDELECCKTLNNIAYSIIGIILVSFIAFILIKKCQAKKIPQVIEEAIAEQNK